MKNIQKFENFNKVNNRRKLSTNFIKKCDEIVDEILSNRKLNYLINLCKEVNLPHEDVGDSDYHSFVKLLKSEFKHINFSESESLYSGITIPFYGRISANWTGIGGNPGQDISILSYVIDRLKNY